MDGMEALTLGHFLIGRALSSLPNNLSSLKLTSFTRCWSLLQKTVEEFW